MQFDAITYHTVYIQYTSLHYVTMHLWAMLSSEILSERADMWLDLQ